MQLIMAADDLTVFTHHIGAILTTPKGDAGRDWWMGTDGYYESITTGIKDYEDDLSSPRTPEDLSGETAANMTLDLDKQIFLKTRKCASCLCAAS